MKKIFLFSLTAVLATTAFSQVKWGVQAIANMSSANIPGLELVSDEGVVKNKSVFAYGLGLSAELPLGREFTLRPSFNFLKKGGGFDASYSDPMLGTEKVNFRTNLYYAELPIHLAINGSLKSGKYFVGFGPSLGFGLAGKAKVDYTYQDPGQPAETESEEVDAFDTEEEGGFKRFEISGSIIGGLQWQNGLYINAGYLVGMNNLFKEDAETSYKHRGLQLTLGYFFSKKK